MVSMLEPLFTDSNSAIRGFRQNEACLFGELFKLRCSYLNRHVKLALLVDTVVAL